MVKQSYKIEVKSDTLGFNNDVYVITGSLKRGNEVIAEIPGDNILEFSSGLLKVLKKEKPTKPVEIKTDGIFYQSGERLLKNIVKNYNNSVSP